MKALAVLAFTGSIGVLAACGDESNGTGAGGYTPGVIAQVAAATGPKTSATSGMTTSGETSSTTQASTGMSSGRMSSASTGMISDPLLPFCGCITDNLGGVGICYNCWQAAVAMDGACEDVLANCGGACQMMLDALETECGMQATPACLETIAEIAPTQVDDFAAVLACLCACGGCDNEACM